MEKLIQYQKKYESELERLKKYLSFLELECGRFWKYDSSDTDYQYLLDRIRLTEARIQYLEEILSDSEKLLKKGTEDDLKEQWEVQQDFLKKKKDYDSFNPLRKLKYRLQFLDLFSTISKNNQRERGK